MPQTRDPQNERREHALQILARELERAQRNVSAGRKPAVGVEGMGCFGAGLFGGLSCLLSVLFCYSVMTGKFECNPAVIPGMFDGCIPAIAVGEKNFHLAVLFLLQLD